MNGGSVAEQAAPACSVTMACPAALSATSTGRAPKSAYCFASARHDPRHDGAVLCAREEPNAGRREIGERVDAFFALEALGVAPARCRRACHALIPSAP